ncbi:hypothetical protein E1287_28860 [Actinomadura sp. KC06]|uniref:trypco2 family protein n=1 Tax=Actinomadura sp. KC06 TaxID=2530369 RepID=UPI0010505B33|nr:trypco2 family protein [Actinomadura sp. KC06]TDD30690.1 hypothetical protein E1287_28860 [Actinomadura sp. KC06]
MTDVVEDRNAGVRSPERHRTLSELRIQGKFMGELGLAESIAALRAELMEALEAGQDAEFGFDVGQIQLEFHVGVTRQAGGSGKAKFWVLELGGDASYRREEIHRVTVTLEPPLDDDGRPVKVTRGLANKP